MDQTYLIFDYRGACYGLDVRAVREIVWLPELSPIEELPPYIAGVFNLRGRVVPVMDLGLRFGHPHQPYRPSDRVIVVDNDEARVGVVADELRGVSALAQAAIEDAPSYLGVGGRAQFVCGGAKLEDGLAMLLDETALLKASPAETALATSAPPDQSEYLSRLYGKLSSEAAEAFRSRARSLAQTAGNGERSDLQSYAVIRLEDELFGLELDLVREFSHLGAITPLPCCPPHIVGNMNLRGDILTLVDIRPALGMATATGAKDEVVVVRSGELLMGLRATEIVDVVELAPADIAAIPIASDRAGKAYCKGIAVVGGRAASILDMQRILAARELQVAEKVR